MNDDDLDLNPPDDEPVDEPADGAPRNVADRRKVESETKRLRRWKREGDEFWRGVFASEVGRREMWAVLQAGHWGQTKFACGPNGFPQPEATWFALGEQTYAQRLHDSWDIIDHEGVYLMKVEKDTRYGQSHPPRKKDGA